MLVLVAVVSDPERSYSPISAPIPTLTPSSAEAVEIIPSKKRQTIVIFLIVKPLLLIIINNIYLVIL